MVGPCLTDVSVQCAAWLSEKPSRFAQVIRKTFRDSDRPNHNASELDAARLRASVNRVSPNRIMKPPNCNHDVLLLPVTGRDDSRLSGGGMRRCCRRRGRCRGHRSEAGDRRCRCARIGGRGRRRRAGRRARGRRSVLVDELLVVGSVVVVDVVLVDELVVGASVVEVVVDECWSTTCSSTSWSSVRSVVVVALCCVDELVVGASVVEVVLDVVDVVLDDVVVDELSVPQPHVCERLNFGLPPLGVISADEPDTFRSVRADPPGTATKTLSCWAPFWMIAAPLTVYDRISRPEVERDRREGERSVVRCDHEVPVGNARVGRTFGARSGGGRVVVECHRLGRHRLSRGACRGHQQPRQHQKDAAKHSDDSHPPTPAIVCHDPVQLSCVFSLRTLSMPADVTDHRSFESSVTVDDTCWSNCSTARQFDYGGDCQPWSWATDVMTEHGVEVRAHDGRDDDCACTTRHSFRFCQGEE